MSYRDENNKLVITPIPVSTSYVLSTTPNPNANITLSKNITNFILNDEPVYATATQINKLNNIVAGTASASNYMITNTAKNISSVNKISVSELYINDLLFDSTPDGSGSSPTIANITAGIAGADKTLVIDSNKKIRGIKQMTTAEMKINQVAITQDSDMDIKYVNERQFNYDISNDTVNNWTQYENAVIPAGVIRKIIWSPYYKVAYLVVRDGTTILIYYSQNLVNWTTSNTSTISEDSFCGIWDPNANRLIGISGSIVFYTVATNGFSTMPSTTSTVLPNNIWTSVAYSTKLELLVVVASSGAQRLASSHDIARYCTTYTIGLYDWKSICWSSEFNMFCAVATDRIITSSDGITWTDSATSSSIACNDICSSPFALVAVGDSKIMYSLNGTSWTIISSPEANNWTSIVWSNELRLFLATSSNGTSRIMYSYDAINWTLKEESIKKSWSSICSIEGKMFMISSSEPSDKAIIYSDMRYPKFDNLFMNNGSFNAFETDFTTGNSILFNQGDKTISDYKLDVEDDTTQVATYLLNLGTYNNSAYTSIKTGNISMNFTTGEAIFGSNTTSIINISNHNGVDTGLMLNNNLLNVSISDINLLSNVLSNGYGVCYPNAAMLVDTYRNISNINNISCTSLTQSNIFNNSSYGLTPIMPDSNNNISINSLSTKKLNNNNNTITSSANLTTALSLLSNSTNATFSRTQAALRFRDIAWSPKLMMFVACISNNGIYNLVYSYDGLGFEYVTMPPAALYCVKWVPNLGLFIVTGQGSIFVSANGLSWALASGYNSSITYDKLFYTDNKIYTIAANSSLYSSTDGLSWTYIRMLSYATIYNVKYINSLSLYIIGALSNLLYCSDIEAGDISVGVNSNTAEFRSIEYGNGTILAAPLVAGQYMYSSTNGTSWSSVSQTGTARYSYIKWVENVSAFYRLVNGSFGINISSDGITWTSNIIRSNMIVDCMEYSPELNVLIASGDSNAMIKYDNHNQYMSNNSLTVNDIYTNVQLPVKALSKLSERVNDTTFKYSSYGNNKVVVVSNNGIAKYTIDGITFSDCTIDSNTWSGITYNSTLEIFCAIGANKAATSSDGITWTSNSITSDNWNIISYSSGFCAVATNKIITSTNGTSWNEYSVSGSWNSIAYSNKLKMLCAVGNSGAIRTSIDGTNWVDRTYRKSNNLLSIIWSELFNCFYCISSGTVLYSYDGIIWIDMHASYSNLVKLVEIPSYDFIALISTTSIMMITINNSLSDLKSFSITDVSDITLFNDLNIFVIPNGKIFTSDYIFPTVKNAIRLRKAQYECNASMFGLMAANPTYNLQLGSDSSMKGGSDGYWKVTSDIRLKKNINPVDLTKCYNVIKELELSRFTWKDEVFTDFQVRDRSKIGWIADKVKEVLPEAITVGNANGLPDCKLLNNDPIIANLYGCIKYLNKKINEQEQDLRNILNAIV